MQQKRRLQMAHFKTRSGELTTLRHNDFIIWHINSGCISFIRQNRRGALELCRDDGDDKFFFPLPNFANFGVLARMIATTHGFSVGVYKISGIGMRAYQFKDIKSKKRKIKNTRKISPDQ